MTQRLAAAAIEQYRREGYYFPVRVLGDLYFPLWFLPETAALWLIVATPFPSVFQLPLDILVERGSPVDQATLLAVQAAWAVAMLGLCRWAQRRGEHTLVVQGG